MKSYALEGLDLAHAIRGGVTADPMIIHQPLLDSVEKFTPVCEQEAKLLAQSSKSGRACVEDEIQALVVAALRSDPLLWPQTSLCVRCGGAVNPVDNCPSCHGSRRVSWGVVAVHHSPLGGERSEREGALLKRAGARAGWPDLDIRLVDVTGMRRSVLLELKAPGGPVRKKQKETILLLGGAGFEAASVVGLKVAVDAVVYALRGGSIR